MAGVPIRGAVAVLLALPAVCRGGAAGELSASTPFSVTMGADEEVTLTSSAGVSCTMSYSTTSATGVAGGDAPAISDAERDGASGLVSGLTGAYARKFGDWEYVVNLGETGSVVQRAAGQTFSLGVANVAWNSGSERPMNRLRFAGGDRCGEKARETEVVLHCGQQKTLVEGREPSTCSYSFALTDPVLCEYERLFPRHPNEAAALGSGGAGGAGAAAAAAGSGLSLDALLPPAARARVLATAGGVEGSLALLKTIRQGLQAAAQAAVVAEGQEGEGGSNREERPGAGGHLSTQDEAGVGGASLGLDDSARHGVLWSGLQPGARDERSGWSFSLHPAWPAQQQQGGGGEGTALPTVWTCAAWTIDDLRRGTEGSGSSAVPLQAASLTLVLPPAGSGAGAGVGATQVSARNERRQELPTRVERAEGEDGSVYVRVTVVDPAGEGEVRAVPELAYLSLTVHAAER